MLIGKHIIQRGKAKTNSTYLFGRKELRPEETSGGRRVHPFSCKCTGHFWDVMVEVYSVLTVYFCVGWQLPFSCVLLPLPYSKESLHIGQATRELWGETIVELSITNCNFIKIHGKLLPQGGALPLRISFSCQQVALENFPSKVWRAWYTLAEQAWMFFPSTLWKSFEYL